MTETRAHSLLIVDDEAQITRVLEAFFVARGFRVKTSANVEAALGAFHLWRPDVIITDLSMPGVSGIALCREIRKTSAVPIIVLSVKGEEKTKVEALEAGADDYVTKPFGMNELLARVRVAIRRGGTPLTGVRETGDFRIDVDAHRIEIRGKEVSLTPKEFELLAFLIRNAGKVITQKAILDAIWNRPYADQSDSVRVLVRQLRKKIEENPAVPRYLKTEPWIGYRFEPGE